MAAAELARGHPVSSKMVSKEVTIFLLMKEFGGTPSQWEDQSVKNIKAITTLLSTYNKVRNAEIDKTSKGKNRSPHRGSNSVIGKKYMREEKIGPNGIEVVDTPI